MAKVLNIPRFNPMHESPEARKIIGPLKFISVPTSQDSGGLGVILAMPEGLKVLGVYILIAELAGRMPRINNTRGWLASERGPMTIGEIAARVRCQDRRNTRAVEVSISVLTRPEIGWLRWVDVPDEMFSSPDSPPSSPRETPAPPLPEPCAAPAGTLSRPCETPLYGMRGYESSSRGEETAAAGAAAAVAPLGGEEKEKTTDPDAYLAPYLAALQRIGIGDPKRSAIARNLAIVSSPDRAAKMLDGLHRAWLETGGGVGQKHVGSLVRDVETAIERLSVRPTPALPQTDRAIDQAAKDRASHAAEVAERDAAFCAIPAELVPELERAAIEAAAPITRERWQKTDARAATHALLKIEVVKLARGRGLIVEASG